MERKNGEADGRKIKELQICNVERDMNQFLQFGQNTGIVTHFTTGTNGLAKEVIRSLLEEVSVVVV